MCEKIVLWAWFNPEFVRSKLIPEIQENCERYGILWSNAYKIFQKNMYAENSLYFHHGYTDRDIPMGQEYKKIAYRKDYESDPIFIQNCHAKILCFFTAFRTQPSDYANHGHHELSLIQFEQGIPQLIYDKLYEITDFKPFNNQNEIWLYSE